jgi:aspartokinase-like uncharacterized kinase
MDQFAHAIAATLDDSALVENLREIAEALAARRVPVLAPSRWLRSADPLPHSWDVTSDSIAAWVAGQVCARLLVLVKPAGAKSGCLTTEALAEVVRRTDVVDPYFSSTLPGGCEALIVSADQIDALRLALSTS